MTRAVLAEFTAPKAFEAALPQVEAAGFHTVETLTPYAPPRDEATEPAVRGLIRNAIIAGLAAAGLLYLVQVLSSVVAYPLDSGGRPHNAWPVFLPASFEIGVLAGALTGFGEFLRRAGLPHLADPVFDAPGVERASQDRFFVALTPVDGASELALRLGALRTLEVEL
jgi:Alternative complex III, ActD subunit